MSSEIIRVVSPLPLTEEQRTIIREKLSRIMKSSSFAMEEEIDPSLIGGIVVFVRDMIIDCSLRTQLQRMKEAILRG